MCLNKYEYVNVCSKPKFHEKSTSCWLVGAVSLRLAQMHIFGVQIHTLIHTYVDYICGHITVSSKQTNTQRFI